VVYGVGFMEKKVQTKVFDRKTTLMRKMYTDAIM